MTSSSTSTQDMSTCRLFGSETAVSCHIPLRCMPFTKFIEYGRLVVLSTGKLEGKLAVITDICDIKTIQVQGPQVPRQLVQVNHVILTEHVKPTTVQITKDKAEGVCKELTVEFEKSHNGQKMHQENVRKNLSDFQRFTAQKLMKMRNQKIHELIGKK